MAKEPRKALDRVEPAVLQATFDELGLTRKQVAEALGVTVSRVAQGASSSPKMRVRSRWSVPVWTGPSRS